MHPASESACGARSPEPEVRGRGEAGFTLAAMLVIMAVMAIALGVAVQTASFQMKREKEEELIFRGNQIVEAVRLFRARNGSFPIGLKQLVEAKPRVLRKAWSDPVTGKIDWVPIFAGQAGQAAGGGTGGTPGAEPTPGTTPQAGGDEFGEPSATPGPTPGAAGFPDTFAVGPVVGVHSRSCATSIKVVDGRDRYCDWQFVFDQSKNQNTRQSGTTPPKLPGKR